MMKKILLSILVFNILSSCIITKGKDGEPGKPGNSAPINNSKPAFNEKLASELGADKYGMKAYTIVMLTTGTTKIDDKNKMGELMKGHLANIGKLADEGKIIVAGPFLEQNMQNFRGMFIFNTKSKEEAEQWVKTDPAVQAGVFSYEIFPWYGSAALPMYLEHHKEISKENP
ncbi:YciI family protein [Chryseobacterium sp. Y16C]|uniref:YciI family protein n=1 Tax=Chryseobacterium sp. Y16C TaxID=2920939 RepID=UPI001F0A721E|nr:YciI family protein [Chryseobacterium sp. Y16C]UMQ40209.1 YciI family protein [Chryseobacterium sp. Y16C]